MITYAVVTALSFMITNRDGPNLGRLYEVWDHWDTGHYMRLATVGYTPDRPDTHAFFPLYPLLLRALDWVLPGPTLVATLVLANALLLPALVVLHRFITETFDRPLGDRTLLVLMAWPAAFFLSAGYNTSLFLLLSVSALYCMRRQAWWAAGLLGALASATRLSGVLLALPFAVEYLRVRGWRWRAAGWDAAAIAADPGRRRALLGVLLGVPRQPARLLPRPGPVGPPVRRPVDRIRPGRRHGCRPPACSTPVAVHNLFDLVSAIVVVTLLVLGFIGPWRLGLQHLYLLVYGAASVLVVLTGPVGGLFPMQGVARYAVEVVPIFLVLARLTAGRAGERLYLLPAIGVQTVLVLTFLNNVWVG